MTDPFFIEGPAAISFSGGRTSALMLRRILDAHGGTLPPDVRVLFANTGKEREETLDFVRECGVRWDVQITWLEYDRVYASGDATGGGYVREQIARVVNYDSASRNGEPFNKLIASRSYLPNTVTRFCTVEMKIRTMHRYLRSLGLTAWTQAIGFRVDEPKRVEKLRGRHETAAEEPVTPLFDAGITHADVMQFWGGQPFDLRLQPWEGNCDLCFLKGQDKRTRVMRDRPDLAAWWIDHEARMGAPFRANRASYATLLERSRRPMLPMALDAPAEDDLDACACTD